ncbi:hypothetical protein DYQ86_04640 [Acidobacteria bacterium AB60]|nr:hypothetical protein DYQ86_04640 [Acidobacteria bacterium AB60]
MTLRSAGDTLDSYRDLLWKLELRRDTAWDSVEYDDLKRILWKRVAELEAEYALQHRIERTAA